MDDCITEHAAHRKAMEMSNKLFLEALNGKPMGDKLIWRGNHMPPLEGDTIARQERYAAQHTARKAAIEAMRVSRGICPRCGANRERGCDHVS